MDIDVRFTSAVAALLICLIPILCVVSAVANPIPVYPDPKLEFSGSNNISTPSVEWILLVFVVDFFVDILIVYAGIYLLDVSNLIKNRDVLDFSKKTFLFAVVLISIAGLLSELMFGAWIGGLGVALFFIFLSFVFVSKYLLKLRLANSCRMGIFAIIVNIVVWMVVFTV